MTEMVHDTWKDSKRIYNEKAKEKPKRIEPIFSFLSILSFLNIFKLFLYFIS